MRSTFNAINKQSPNDKRDRKKKSNDDKPEQEDRRNLLTTQVKARSKDAKNSDKRPHNNNSSVKDEQEKAQLPVKRRFENCFCYFCNAVGHSPNFCKVWKLTFVNKKDCAIRHNACLLCLKVDGHKSKDCTFKIKQCAICKGDHNMNLHAQKDKVQHFKDLKANRSSNGSD